MHREYQLNHTKTVTKERAKGMDSIKAYRTRPRSLFKELHLSTLSPYGGRRIKTQLDTCIKVMVRKTVSVFEKCRQFHLLTTVQDISMSWKKS
jgi:hypothetical protein